MVREEAGANLDARAILIRLQHEVLSEAEAATDWELWEEVRA